MSKAESATGRDPRRGRPRGGAPPRSMHEKTRVDRLIAQMPGNAALPRRNGELVFDAPWESRAFGMAVALHNAGAFEWQEFQRHLIDDIAAWERAHGQELSSWNYYQRWLSALETLLLEKGLCSEDEMQEMLANIGARSSEDEHLH